MEEDKLGFVTFYHPGAEHRPDSKNAIGWNAGKHKRKFLRQRGHYIDSATDEKVHEDTLYFWGEWEPESRVVRISKPVPNGPHYIYSPYYVPRTSYLAVQNTDPYVFGTHFLYTCCQQFKKKGLTYKPQPVRYLSKGSVIIFGSHKAGNFILDTVFVVGGYTDHNFSDYRIKLRNKVTTTYMDVSLKPLYERGDEACQGSKTKSVDICRQGYSFRLYYGSNYEEKNRLNGMFSFTPCLVGPAGESGFRRPVVDINHSSVISASQKQGIKVKELKSLDEAKNLWLEIVDNVLTQGCKLGIYLEEPSALVQGYSD
ncbi:MAG: hypothetical protein QHH75_05810 [Bacillota bacterium]|jgi:hypothetical protein|nr:hypothetical protein [Bacillota bacterium]